MGLHALGIRLRGTKLWRLVGMAIAMFSLVVLLPGCSVGQLRLENFRVQSADVPTLISTVIGEPKTFNYLLTQESSSTDVLALMYEGLIGVDQTNSE
ncbi:MAG: ABC transporter substrate-binding protein, partial [Cyanobacteria bacterium J06631_9]